MKLLEGKTAIVTGASRGIGRLLQSNSLKKAVILHLPISLMTIP